MNIFGENNDLLRFRDELNAIRSIRIIHNTERARKTYKNRINPMNEYDDYEFRRRYRFSKENMERIVDLVKEDLLLDRRGGSLPVGVQVMAVIRHWGRHEIQEDCADIHGLSQQTMSRLCQRVAFAIASKSQQFIHMPRTPREEANTIEKFRSICGFPSIVGAIDCTHVKIRKVGGDAGQYYVNRKGHYSINTQVVCNSDLKIMDIVCHWRGSTHDSRIFRESSIKERFENSDFNGNFLGDSGYACTPYLLTPVLRPSSEAENRYNNSHIRTRNTVERCFGVLKQRFRILQGVMRGSLQTIKATIVACAVLHNLAIEFNDNLNEGEYQEEPAEESEVDVPTQANLSSVTRTLFIERHF